MRAFPNGMSMPEKRFLPELPQPAAQKTPT